MRCSSLHCFRKVYMSLPLSQANRVRSGCALRASYSRTLQFCHTSGSDASLVREGDRLEATRTFSESDICLFASLSQDFNPVHADDASARAEGFEARIVHGMLYASMFGAIVAKSIPGAVYVSQTLDFRRPVYVGDEVTAAVVVSQVRYGGRVLSFDTTCSNQRGQLVLSGTARVMLPRAVRPSGS